MSRPGPRSQTGRAWRRANGWGVAAAILYLITAVLWPSGERPPALLYDGLAPLPPYRWVSPPPELARGNQPPESGVGDVPFGPEGLSPLSVTTGDGQAAVILNAKTVPPRTGETAVRVTLVPVDPRSLAPPPAGLRFDSNAYRVEARYIPSGTQVRLRAPATVVLRYASGATGIARFSGSVWAQLTTKRYDAAQIITADAQTLGLFAAMAPATLPYTPSHAWRLYGALVLLALVVVLAFSFTRRFRRRPRG